MGQGHACIPSLGIRQSQVLARINSVLLCGLDEVSTLFFSSIHSIKKPARVDDLPGRLNEVKLAVIY
jgi:hypothetical protein